MAIIELKNRVRIKRIGLPRLMCHNPESARTRDDAHKTGFFQAARHAAGGARAAPALRVSDVVEHPPAALQDPKGAPVELG
jgi:hypothetical protein